MSEFGLSKNLIIKYLPKPEYRKNPHYRNAAPMKIWTQSQIETALRNPELKEALKKSRRRKAKQKIKELGIDSYLMSFDISSLQERARSLDRHFVLHIGPTNSGKTHDALQALKNVESGLYLGPLRLLALEMFDRMNLDGCPCSLLTGEEYIETPGALHTSSTIELCDYDSSYDIAVIDEAQMIADRFRGDRWAKAIYCVDAREVHICLAPEAETIITEIISSFGSGFEIVRHERLAPLRYSGVMKNIRQAQPGDALIVFSRKAVLSVSAELEHSGIKTSVIYGALPPSSRREEVRRFSEHETSVVVATDAIGMGVSLPIKRVVFCETRKFDGKSTRSLRSGEVKQIAGRAGRFGIYDIGEVLTMSDEKLVSGGLVCDEKQLSVLTLPFPEESLSSSYSIPDLLSAWDRLPPVPGFARASMEEALALHGYLKPIAKKMDKSMVYSLITCPLDVKDMRLVGYWQSCCFAIYNNTVLPEPYAGTGTLEDCETRYKQLDIRHQLLRRIGVEEDRMDEKLELGRLINEYLAKSKDQYLKHCTRCGKILPSTSPYGMCNKCYEKYLSYNLPF